MPTADRGDFGTSLASITWTEETLLQTVLAVSRVMIGVAATDRVVSLRDRLGLPRSAHDVLFGGDLAFDRLCAQLNAELWVDVIEGTEMSLALDYEMLPPSTWDLVLEDPFG